MTFYDGQHNHYHMAPSPVPAAVLPAYNVSAAITQAFSRLAQEEESRSVYTQLSSAHITRDQVYPWISRQNEFRSPAHIMLSSSALNLSTTEIQTNSQFENGSYVIRGPSRGSCMS